jgi:hypothetical protein
MMRQEGWEERFMAEVRRHHQLPFTLGVSDCFLLPMDVVAAITGVDPVDPGGRDYSSLKGARAKLKKAGYTDLPAAFAARFEEIAPSLAQRGDIGIADYDGALLGGGVVVLGAEVIGKGEHGNRRLPLAQLKRAFKVA